MSRLAGLIWTWPYYCTQSAAYVLCQRWAFDLHSLNMGYENNQGRRQLREHFKGFIKLILACLLLLYLFYMFALPDSIAFDDMWNLLDYLAILSFIIAACMLCLFLCGALRTLRSSNRQVGNAAYTEAFVFFASQVIAGLFNLWLVGAN